MKIWKINKHGIFEQESGIKISYPEIGNDLCFAIEEQSPWFIQRNDLILLNIEKYGGNGDFLDIGGGNGCQSKALINSQYNGKVILCEPGKKGCMNAINRGVVLVYNGTFQDFPFNDYNIANCGLFDVIEHIEDDIFFLNELYSKIKIGTKIFISVPAIKHLWSETDEVVGHYRRYEKTDIERITQKTSFKLINYTYYFSYYYFPMFLARVIPYKLGIRLGAKNILLKEQRNLKNDKGIIDSLLNMMHKKCLNKLKNDVRINIGTSLFFVLEK